ncbi:platelet-activating factor acetylhydrolase [Microcaecilia unicolor]|uniref:Platelet-activating factor acetylhydrolase n=1 Tax=Microcaecilia unicolor TaxID=1415580 RepID=A0A6P7XGK1_9AMPH|nr:platelet-activating factor acetylhydrolase [Microcaecilia unicolor]XP_030054643.1 platelet-activating factor acetylhydrolase [Microcaecilia unicolor]XP_030054644.1 platelet-activating factor acetylhydrolase [Microcaecilia unicolor]
MGSSSSAQSKIPAGEGPHTVGCTDLMSDHTIYGSFLRLYYPCREDTFDEEPAWIPRREYYWGLADNLKMNRTLVDTIFGYYYGSVKCPAKWNAPFKSGETYPLIIFSHGLGAFRTLYSAICTELASQGFVVASVEHRDESASATYYLQDMAVSNAEKQTAGLQQEVWIYYRHLKPGEDEFPLRSEQVHQRAEECIKALNLMLDINDGKKVTNALSLPFDWSVLKNSIDINRMCVAGHSFGGATAIQSLSKDARFRCGIALDAWMFPLKDEIYSSVQQPLLFINSETFQSVDSILKMKKFDSTEVERKMITIKGSVHQSFPDFTFLTGAIIAKIFKLKGQIDPYTAIGIINKATLAFLQQHLCLQKDFNKWDALVDGQGVYLIPGTNINLPLTQ